MKVKNFSFLNLDKFIQTHSHLDKSKPIFLLIILIQIVPISFYFINTGFILYGSEILQAIHMDEIISLFTFLTIFFIVLSLSMLYLIKLLDKKIIKNVMSILHGEYVALHEMCIRDRYLIGGVVFVDEGK